MWDFNSGLSKNPEKGEIWKQSNLSLSTSRGSRKENFLQKINCEKDFSWTSEKEIDLHVAPSGIRWRNCKEGRTDGYFYEIFLLEESYLNIFKVSVYFILTFYPLQYHPLHYSSKRQQSHFFSCLSIFYPGSISVSHSIIVDQLGRENH